MVTTFTSRELVRDELAALFVANGSWQNVYHQGASLNSFSGKSPILIIRSRGTAQEFANLENNPTSYRFLLSSWVLAYRASDSWDNTEAEDKLDELDKVVRQVIRNNAGSMTTANILYFEEGMSQVDDVIIEGLGYIVETRAVIAHLSRGAI